MLALCHSYRLTPSVPVGADRLIGSHCSTSESKEGKLWPLPCSLASLVHFTGHSSEAPALTLCSFFTISLFLPEFFFYFDFTDLLAHSSPAHFPFVCARLPLSHLDVSSPPPLHDFSLPCICHSHSPSLFISRLYVSVYPGLECHNQVGRSHSLLLHLLAWSPISLYRHCHPFLLHCSLSVSVSSVRLCHLLHLSTSPSALITFSTQSNPGDQSAGDFMVKSTFKVQSKLFSAVAV